MLWNSIKVIGKYCYCFYLFICPPQNLTNISLKWFPIQFSCRDSITFSFLILTHKIYNFAPFLLLNLFYSKHITHQELMHGRNQFFSNTFPHFHRHTNSNSSPPLFGKVMASILPPPTPARGKRFSLMQHRSKWWNKRLIHIPKFKLPYAAYSRTPSQAALGDYALSGKQTPIYPQRSNRGPPWAGRAGKKRKKERKKNCCLTCWCVQIKTQQNVHTHTHTHIWWHTHPYRLSRYVQQLPEAMVKWCSWRR